MGAGAGFYANNFSFENDQRVRVIFGREFKGVRESLVAIEIMPETHSMNHTLRMYLDMRKKALSASTIQEAEPVDLSLPPQGNQMVANYVACCSPMGWPEFSFGYYSMRYLNEAAFAKQEAISVMVPTIVTVRTTPEVEIAFLNKLLAITQ